MQNDPLLRLISPNKVNISFYNQSGALVLSYANVQLPTPLNISALPIGNYIVNFEFMGQVEGYTIIKNQ